MAQIVPREKLGSLQPIGVFEFSGVIFYMASTSVGSFDFYFILSKFVSDVIKCYNFWSPFS